MVVFFKSGIVITELRKWDGARSDEIKKLLKELWKAGPSVDISGVTRIG